MNSGTVKTFCDAASQLLPAIGEFGALDPEKRKPEDDALVRQLKVVAGALANALIMVPPSRPPMRPPQPPMPAQVSVPMPTR